MLIRVLSVFTITAFVQKTLCSDLDEEIDVKLSTPTEDLKAESRYSFVTTTFYDWIKNVNLVNYGSYYLTFPEKTTGSVFFNGTVSNVFPLSYTLAGAALIAYVSAYLLSFIPIGATSSGHNRNDYFDPDLGYGLQRDTEIFFDEFGNEITDYDYQYPDSIDFDSFSSFSSASEPKVTTRRVDGQPVNRKGVSRAIKHKKEPKSIERPGILQDLSSKFWSLFGSPVKRSGNSASEGFGIDKIIQRYDDYWKRRRSGTSKKSSNIPENTFRHKDRNSANHQYAKPSAPLPTTRGIPGFDSFIKGPSWPGQNTVSKATFGDTDVDEVYGNHFGVEENKKDSAVEYVYSQK